MDPYQWDSMFEDEEVEDAMGGGSAEGGVATELDTMIPVVRGLPSHDELWIWLTGDHIGLQ